jgi:hypothetical protein
MLPPNAGRICVSVWSWYSSWVQSAVRPVPSRAATRGASDRPISVEPTSTTEGRILSIASATAGA